jgi:hypothetical protein
VPHNVYQPGELIAERARRARYVHVVLGVDQANRLQDVLVSAEPIVAKTGILRIERPRED